MIKAIITDVDGVIVGKTQGVNFPLPNNNVVRALKDLRRKKIPVVLCTAKFNHAIRDIIIQAKLNNPHITDGGALIVDPLDNKIIKKHIFDPTLTQEIVKICLANKFYTEVYGAEDYYLQKDHISAFTNKRKMILQKEQISVDSLPDRMKSIDVIKITISVHSEQERHKVDNLLKPFTDKIHIIHSHHPSTLPSQYIVITEKSVSKKVASLEVLDYLKIKPEETLGVGDGEADWNFMSLCNYVGVVGDASQKLKELAKAKGEGSYYFGTSVDEDGFLQILDYFNL